MKRLMYLIPLSAVAVLVFATIAAAQGVLQPFAVKLTHASSMYLWMLVKTSAGR